jgi:hypothetical protein
MAESSDTITRTRKKRAAKIPSPGAARITLTGIMAVPDDFGRLRIILVDRTSDGQFDPSLGNLRDAIPYKGPQFSLPYEMKIDKDDDTVGTATIFVPDRYKKHWGAVAESLRGLEVKLEATLRPFTIHGKDASTSGVALDLAMLEPLVATTPKQ